MATREQSNPFPGLRVFEPDEDHLFFGRERETDELLRRLGTTRFLSVVGASGSGKSSLVRSGMIPSLQSGFMVRAGSSWRVAILRPGEDPIGNLAAALDGPEVLGQTGELQQTQRAILEATLRGSARGLADAVAQAGLAEHENILVVVDQFEELFRFHRSRMLGNARDDAVAFVKLLLEAARQQSAPIYVVLTMRADFIGDCMAYPGLPEAINAGQYLVPRMTRDELRLAITGPVAVGGARITARLVVRLLNEVGDDPDQLPVLQHALMRTWDFWARYRSPDEPVDVYDYEAIGTMKGALSLHAEEAYQELIENAMNRVGARYEGKRFARRARERETRAEIAAVTTIVRKLFKALTDTSSDNRGVRRPTTVEEVRAICETDVERVYEVVESFRKTGRAFLMPPADVPLRSESILDLSHESLMRLWGRLVDWTGDERTAAMLYQRLARNGRRWEQGTQGLWRNPELRLARRWRATQRPTAAWARRYDPSFDRAMLFLDKSKQGYRRRLLLWFYFPLVIGGAALYFLGCWFCEPVETFACRLEARDMALQAAQLPRAEERVAGACAAYRLMLSCPGSPDPDRPEIYAALLRAVDALHPASTIALDVPTCQDPGRATSEHPVRAVEFAHGGRTLVAGNEAGRVYLIDAATRERLADATLFSAGVRALASNQAQELLAAGSVDGTIRLWRVSASSRGSFPAGGIAVDAGGPVGALAIRAQGDLLAAALGDGTIRLWAIPSGRAELRAGPAVRTHSAGASSIDFSPDGRDLATGTPDGALVWNVSRLREAGSAPPEPRLRACAGRTVTAVALGDRILACGDSGGTIEIVRIDSPNPAAHSLSGHTSGINALSLSTGPDGEARLASGSFDGSVRVWKQRDGRWDPLPIVLTDHDRWVWAVALGPDGQRLASGSEDRTVRLWESRSEGLAEEICSSRPLPSD